MEPTTQRVSSARRDLILGVIQLQVTNTVLSSHVACLDSTITQPLRRRDGTVLGEEEATITDFLLYSKDYQWSSCRIPEAVPEPLTIRHHRRGSSIAIKKEATRREGRWEGE